MSIDRDALNEAAAECRRAFDDWEAAHQKAEELNREWKAAQTLSYDLYAKAEEARTKVLEIACSKEPIPGDSMLDNLLMIRPKVHA